MTTAAPPPVGMPRVLVMTPDVNVLCVIKSSLDRHGFEVDTALQADIALRLYGETEHAAVVVDDGAGSNALCQRLLAVAASRRATPFVLALSERDAPTELPGGVERVDKPLSLRYLVARLTGQLGFFAISAER